MENGSSFPFYGFHTPVPTTSPPGQSPSAVPDSISSGKSGLFRCCRVLTEGDGFELAADAAWRDGGTEAVEEDGTVGFVEKGKPFEGIGSE